MRRTVFEAPVEWTTHGKNDFVFIEDIVVLLGDDILEGEQHFNWNRLFNVIVETEWVDTNACTELTGFVCMDVEFGADTIVIVIFVDCIDFSAIDDLSINVLGELCSEWFQSVFLKFFINEIIVFAKIWEFL